MKSFNYLFIFICGIVLMSCRINEQEKLEHLLNQWNGKEIIFPENPIFTVYGQDTIGLNIPNDGYKIVHYLDSTGCTTCKLDLERWQSFIVYMDSVTQHSVPCLFFIHAKQKREVKIALKESHFDYPVCLDLENELYKLNKFPSHPLLQTFLLDGNNKVVAMGDPVKNPHVKELFVNLIKGKTNRTEMKHTKTTVQLNQTVVNMGTFYWEEKQDTVVELINIGDNLLAIHDVLTSCGCTVADYDKIPIRKGEKLDVKISYKAEHPERFNKTIAIYCNVEQSPLIVRIKGEAQIK